MAVVNVDYSEFETLKNRVKDNRFFKPKGVESILAQIIQKCEQ